MNNVDESGMNTECINVTGNSSLVVILNIPATPGTSCRLNNISLYYPEGFYFGCFILKNDRNYEPIPHYEI